jgi:DNA-binding transcriptional MerR regulator
MHIGELSRRSGVSARSLRYYEQHGLIAADRGANGYRDYGEATVARAATIHSLFGMGFPRAVVSAVLACTGDASPRAHDEVVAPLTRVRDDMAERIRLLTETHDALTEFLDGRD